VAPDVEGVLVPFGLVLVLEAVAAEGALVLLLGLMRAVDLFWVSLSAFITCVSGR
jgi:hypothetical protein